MNTQLLFQIQSVLIVVLMFYGITQHKTRKRHVKIMSASIIWDILLIAQIELSRSAIAKAGKAVVQQASAMLYVHLFFAISTVLLYILVVKSGRQLLNGNNSNINKHKIIGLVTFSFRILTLITSFFAVSKSI